MSEKFCTECREVISAGAKFCAACGHPVGGQASPPAKAVSSGGNWRRDGLIVVGLIVVVAVSYWFVRETPQAPEPAQVTGPEGHEGMGSALTNVPTDYAGLVSGGNQHMDAGNFPMAAEFYGRAMKIDGSSPDVRTDYGSCLHAMGLAERGLEEFRKVYLEHPDHNIVRYNMGIVHYGLGRLDSAKQYWEEFLAGNPEGGAAESARDYLKEMEQ